MLKPHRGSAEIWPVGGSRQLSRSDEDQCLTCQAEHENEGLLLEDIGRLLGDVRASARSVPLHILTGTPPIPAATPSFQSPPLSCILHPVSSWRGQSCSLDMCLGHGVVVPLMQGLSSQRGLKRRSLRRTDGALGRWQAW